MSMYIGRCPECGAINAGSVAGNKQTGMDVKAMIDEGLQVELDRGTGPVELRDCEHCKAKREARKGGGSPEYERKAALYRSEQRDALRAVLVLQDDIYCERYPYDVAASFEALDVLLKNLMAGKKWLDENKEKRT